ncbi:hypothetical protein VARIO8X_60476 [Burkholderiales bacterium 8X]|nr:hypothetical protein VARIO8X_60476 [Burkholderiales bacterium 8X]
MADKRMTYETLMLEAEERAVPSTRVRKMALPWNILALFTLSSIVALTVLLYEPSRRRCISLLWQRN